MRNFYHMGINNNGENVIIIYGYIVPNKILNETKVDYDNCYVYVGGSLPELQDISVITAVKNDLCQKTRHAGDYLATVGFDGIKTNILDFLYQKGKLQKVPVDSIKMDINMDKLKEVITLRMVVDNWKKMDGQTMNTIAIDDDFDEEKILEEENKKLEQTEKEINKNSIVEDLLAQLVKENNDIKEEILKIKQELGLLETNAKKRKK